MLAYHLIEKKQAGQALNRDEINFLVNGYVAQQIPDYQMSAFLMAVYFQGMTQEELNVYIDVILNSGNRVKFEDNETYYVDKHSTGGVGDKISLILAPLAMASGEVKVPMVSGRGLGHSGGTLDKLESIPGFSTSMSLEAFKAQTDRIGCALIGQTEDLCPADKVLYALRDVTATVRSVPLICGSILSKKIAEGIQGLVLDIKTGNGAFMQEYDKAKHLGQQLKYFGEAYGLAVQPVMTNMNQPLGRAVGNWLEVKESLDVLQGGGPADVRLISLELTAQMIKLKDPKRDLDSIKAELAVLLDNGKAYEAFLTIAETQGAHISYLQHPETYPQSKCKKEIFAEKDGFIKAIDTYQIGFDAINLGAGRRTVKDIIDPKAGCEIHVSVGDQVTRGDRLATLYSDKKDKIDIIAADLAKRFELSDTNCPPLEAIYEIL